MTAEQRIDEALDRVLRAAGSRLDYYTMPSIRENLRAAMREIMSESYIAGSNACHAAMKQATQDKHS